MRINDAFWGRYREIVRTGMIPFQWSVLNDEADITIERERTDGNSPSEKSHAIENFKIAAGRSEGEHYGWVFQDSDVYKWLEAVGYSLRSHPDDDLKAIADKVVELIADAQDEDGYLNTFYKIKFPERRFKRLAESHELYCAGHFFEAACAYHEATGNELVLTTAKRLADCLVRTFGADKEVNGFDGHEEVKVGLMKLYRATGNEDYLKLTKYFLDVRGTVPDFFATQLKNDPGEDPIKGVSEAPLSYFQADVRPVDQTVARGHAVRQVYLLTAMADYAAETGDGRIFEACVRLWDDITKRQMYITGGIGSTVHGEAFTTDYDLPNDTMYCETCAAVGLVFFARQMLRNRLSGEYADVMERVIYNSAISGMALDGMHFFYVNPLEVVPELSKKDPGKPHVKAIRPSWLGCACCPPNLARLIASIDDYVYTVTKYEGEPAIAVNLFVSGEAEFDVGGVKLSITSETDYPNTGKVRFRLHGDGKSRAVFAVRIPGFAADSRVTLNGRPAAIEGVGVHMEASPSVCARDGYVYIKKAFGNDEVELEFTLEPIFYEAHPYVRDDCGKVALQRGPFVYCLESVDNGEHLELVSVDVDAPVECCVEQDAKLGEIVALYASGKRLRVRDDVTNEPLYRPLAKRERRSTTAGNTNSDDVRLRYIPYYAWANRGENEMCVWVRKQ